MTRRFLPESARWLLVRGRINEAKVIIENIARTNGNPHAWLASEFLVSFLTNGLISGRPVPAEIEFQTEENIQPESIRELRHAPNLLCRTLIIFFNWYAIS